MPYPTVSICVLLLAKEPSESRLDRRMGEKSEHSVVRLRSFSWYILVLRERRS